MNSKDVLKYCVNFYDIVNYEVADDDSMTENIIILYREFIFRIKVLNEPDIKYLVNLDEAMKRYIDDYYFRIDLQDCMKAIKLSHDTNDVIRIFLNKVVEFYNNYHNCSNRSKYNSRWI